MSKKPWTDSPAWFNKSDARQIILLYQHQMQYSGDERNICRIMENIWIRGLEGMRYLKFKFESVFKIPEIRNSKGSKSRKFSKPGGGKPKRILALIWLIIIMPHVLCSHNFSFFKKILIYRKKIMFILNTWDIPIELLEKTCWIRAGTQRENRNPVEF
jgi:hypothetical protein